MHGRCAAGGAPILISSGCRWYRTFMACGLCRQRGADLAALNRIEMLPCDVWGMMSMDDAGLSDENKVLLDIVSALTLADDPNSFREMRPLYESDDRLRVPAMVFNAMRQKQESATS